MPQMSPTLWTILLITSTFLMIQQNSMTFFNSTLFKQKKLKKPKSSNWKW